MPRVGPYDVFEPIARTSLGLHRLAAHALSPGVSRSSMLILEADPEGRARLMAEAQVFASVVHPGLLPVQGAGDAPEGSYLAHDWVPGRTLADLLQAMRAAGHSLDPTDALFVVTHLLQALHAMHAAGWVHRGLRPEAVWVGDNGEVYLTGLFAAAQVGTAGAIPPPLNPYLAPELTGTRPADPRSDVYGAGLLLRAMLLGQAPFEGSSTQLQAQILAGGLPPVGTLAPRLTANLQRMVDAAVTRDPQLRPPTVGALRDELARVLYDRDPSYGPGRLAALLRQVFPAQVAHAEERRASITGSLPPASPSADLLDEGMVMAGVSQPPSVPPLASEPSFNAHDPLASLGLGAAAGAPPRGFEGDPSGLPRSPSGASGLRGPNSSSGAIPLGGSPASGELSRGDPPPLGTGPLPMGGPAPSRDGSWGGPPPLGTGPLPMGGPAPSRDVSRGGPPPRSGGLGSAAGTGPLRGGPASGGLPWGGPAPRSGGLGSAAGTGPLGGGAASGDLPMGSLSPIEAVRARRTLDPLPPVGMEPRTQPEGQLIAPLEATAPPPPVAPTGSFDLPSLSGDLSPAADPPLAPPLAPPSPPPPLPPEEQGSGMWFWGLMALALVVVLGGVAMASGGGSLWDKLRVAFIGRKAGATLRVESIPPGALLVLDGQETGRKTPVTIENIESEVQHTVKLVLGAEVQTGEVSLTAGQKHTMNLAFPDAVVTLKIQSTPPGAELYLDGSTARVFTPAELQLRTQQETKLELRKVGYLTWTQTVTPTPRQDLSLDIKLKKSEDLKEAEAAEAAALGKKPKRAKRAKPARAKPAKAVKRAKPKRHRPPRSKPRRKPRRRPAPAAEQAL